MPETSKTRVAYTLYLALLTACLLLSLAAFLVSGWRALRNPFQLNYGEGIVIWQAQHVTHFQEAYRDVRQFPHLVFHYPPVFHLTARLAVNLTGDLLTAGRLVSLLAALGISLLSGALVWEALPRVYPFPFPALRFLL